MAHLILLIVTTCAAASCVRRPAPPPDGWAADGAPSALSAPPPGTEPRGGAPKNGEQAKPAPLPGSLPPADRPPPGKEPERNAAGEAPVAMKPAAKPKPAARPAPASSLGGHDRHLVLRPFEPLAAADFELGGMTTDAADPGFRALLEALESGLVSGRLPFDRFGDRAAGVARVLYGEPELGDIVTARFSAPAIGPGGVYSAAVRVFARREGDAGATPIRSASGLVIAAPDASGAWVVEHFELDLAALDAPPERTEPWDPYGASPSR